MRDYFRTVGLMFIFLALMAIGVLIVLVSIGLAVNVDGFYICGLVLVPFWIAAFVQFVESL